MFFCTHPDEPVIGTGHTVGAAYVDLTEQADERGYNVPKIDDCEFFKAEKVQVELVMKAVPVVKPIVPQPKKVGR